MSAPEVLECHMVAGGFDYLVKARLADMTAYRRFLGETLLALPGCARPGPTRSWKRSSATRRCRWGRVSSSRVASWFDRRRFASSGDARLCPALLTMRISDPHGEERPLGRVSNHEATDRAASVSKTHHAKNSRALFHRWRSCNLAA
jgi:Lrp/AsnC ligand binding domain